LKPFKLTHSLSLTPKLGVLIMHPGRVEVISGVRTVVIVRNSNGSSDGSGRKFGFCQPILYRICISIKSDINEQLQWNIICYISHHS